MEAMKALLFVLCSLFICMCEIAVVNRGQRILRMAPTGFQVGTEMS